MWDKNYSNKSGAGRPPLPEDEKRKNNLKVRVSNDEIEALRKLHKISNEVSQSELVRKLLFQIPLPVRVKNIELTKLIWEINGLKSELRKAVKSKNFIELKTEIDEVKKMYEILAKSVDEVKTTRIFLNDLEPMLPEEKIWN